MVLIGIVAILLVVAVLLALEAVVVMWLWNYLAPAVIPLSDVSFWQAMALVVLTSLLFGNMFRSVGSTRSVKESGEKK